MKARAKYYIQNLKLNPHPEGGYYNEFYRSDEKLAADNLPSRYNSERSFGTIIYYLLEENQKSRFHMLKSDEAWHHIDGCTVLIHCISEDGEYSKIKVGKDLAEGELPQVLIPKNTWFAAELMDKSEFTLVGCTVFPGFEFDDFTLADKKNILNQFPQHKRIIDLFT
jgi:predicted cupin superfamily sugar epimerase